MIWDVRVNVGLTFEDRRLHNLTQGTAHMTVVELSRTGAA